MIIANLALLALSAVPSHTLQTAIHGKVLDESGKPIANAKVYIVKSELREPTISQTLTSAQDGTFQANVELPTDQRTWLGVLAVDSVHGPAFKPIAGQTSFDLTLPQASSVDVKLLTPDGKPAAGIAVRPQIIVLKKEGQEPVRFINLPGPLRQEMGAQTNALGIAHLAGFPKGGEVLLLQTDERYAQLGYKERVTAADSGEPLVINLRPGCTVSGKVLGADGQPAAGIVVAAQGIADRAWAECRTGADGTYKLTQLPPDEYNVALDLSPEQADEWTAPAHEKVATKPDRALIDLDFHLTKGSIIEGVVLDDKGNPVAGAMVGVYGPAHPNSTAWVQSTTADASGHYRLRLPAGEQKVYVMGSGSHGVGPQSMKSVKTTEGETVKVDLKVSSSQ